MLTTTIYRTMLAVSLIGCGSLMTGSTAYAQQSPAPVVTQGNICRSISVSGTKTCVWTAKRGTQCKQDGSGLEDTVHWSGGTLVLPADQGWECEGDFKVGGTHYWEPLPITDEACKSIVAGIGPGNAPVTQNSLEKEEWQCAIKRQHEAQDEEVCRVMGGTQLQHCMWNTNTDHCSRGNIVAKAEACQGAEWESVEPANWWCETEASKSGLTTGWSCLMR